MADPPVNYQEYADALFGGDLDVILAHFSETGSFLGPGMLSAFCDVLCGRNYQNVREYHDMDLSIALTAAACRPSHMLKHCGAIISFVEAGRGGEPVAEFIDGVKDRPEWRQFPVPEQWAWNMLWTTLMMGPDIDITAETFQHQINQMFQLPKGRHRSGPFTISISDIEKVGITIIPTRCIEQHLMLEGNTLKVLHNNPEVQNCCRTYSQLRAAKALGIASLGQEVLVTFHVLYGKEVLFQRAEELEIFSFNDDAQRTASTRLSEMQAKSQTPIKVLAHRIHILEKVVKNRGSWWPTLMRDIKKQSETQPIVFYGSILAIISVVCTVLQTIATFWGLALVLRAK